MLAADRLRVERGGATVLDVPSLSVFEGETLAVIGSNGAGKSTLLLALATILKASAGVVLFRGRPVGAGEAALPYRRKIAVAFQEPLLFDGTVAWNAAEGLRLRGVPPAKAARRAGEMLERLKVAHLAGRSARTLSGGEAQRVSLARAFAVDPEVIFLDEPFSALDPESRDGIVDDLEATLRESGTTAVFVTHDRVEALRLGDRIAVMNGGRIAQIGTPDEVMNRPADGNVASFVGVETVLDAFVVATDAGTFVARVGTSGSVRSGPVGRGGRNVRGRRQGPPLHPPRERDALAPRGVGHLGAERLPRRRLESDAAGGGPPRRRRLRRPSLGTRHDARRRRTRSGPGAPDRRVGQGDGDPRDPPLKLPVPSRK